MLRCKIVYAKMPVKTILVCSQIFAAQLRFTMKPPYLFAFGYVLGTTNPHLGLSPLRLRPCRAHYKKVRVFLRPNFLHEAAYNVGLQHMAL